MVCRHGIERCGPNLASPSTLYSHCSGFVLQRENAPGSMATGTGGMMDCLALQSHAAARCGSWLAKDGGAAVPPHGKPAAFQLGFFFSGGSL